MNLHYLVCWTCCDRMKVGVGVAISGRHIGLFVNYELAWISALRYKIKLNAIAYSRRFLEILYVLSLYCYF